jgi:hypothetical protein
LHSPFCQMGGMVQWAEVSRPLRFNWMEWQCLVICVFSHGSVYFLRPRLALMGLVARRSDEDRPVGVDVNRRWGEEARTGDLCRGDSLVGWWYSMLSSSLRASCSRRTASSAGSREMFDRDPLRMLRMLLISSPVCALREIYCWRLRISWANWSFKVAIWNKMVTGFDLFHRRRQKQIWWDQQM